MATKKSRRKSEFLYFTLEIVLILAAVLIFRSSWMILDSIPLFSTLFALVIMLILGILATLITVYLMFQHNKKH